MAGILLGTALGAVIAGSYSSSTAERQIVAEDRRARSEFQRTQQQSAYAQLLTEERNLGDASSAYLNLRQFGKPTPEEILAKESEFSSQASKARQALSIVELAGSENAIALADELLNANYEYYLRVRRHYALMDDTQGQPLNLEDLSNRMRDVRANLLRQARIDLGTS